MPIAQDRLIALIEICDQYRDERERLCERSETELEEATTEFYANNGNENELASNLLSRLQNLAAMISTSILSVSAIETLVREREHFRLRSAENARQRLRRQRKRHETRSDLSDFESPTSDFDQNPFESEIEL